MTNEKMLELLYKLRTLAHQGDHSEAARVLIDAEATLKEDIRHDCMKAKGLVKRDKLATIVYDNMDPKRPLLHGWHTCDQGKKAICDGYRLYATDEDFGYEKAKEQLGPMDRLVPRGETVPLSVDLAQLKAYIKEQKALVRSKAQKQMHPIIYDAGRFRIGFNPVYLLEFCQFFDTTTVYVTGPKSPLQYRDMDSGDWGILLPCHIVDPGPLGEG